MEREPELTDLGITRFQILLFVMEVIFPGICACVLSAIQIVDAVVLGYRFSLLLPGSSVATALARLFFSEKFFLVLIHAVFATLHCTIFVMSFATLYCTGLFRARAKAILADWPNQTEPVISFSLNATTAIAGFIAVIPTAFRLLDEVPLVPFMQLCGGAVYLAVTVCMAVLCRLACAVPVLKDASDSIFDAKRSSFSLVGVRKFWAAAAVCALLDGIFIALAVLTAFYFQSQFLASVTATTVVLCTVVVVMLVTQPLFYIALSDSYQSTTAPHLG